MREGVGSGSGVAVAGGTGEAGSRAYKEQWMQPKADPWIESPQGGWFFVNAVLVAPELVVLFPLLAGMVVSFLAPGREPSPFLDTIPFVASKAIPLLGWLLVIPIWTTIRALRVPGLRLPRVALGVFLLIHLSFLGYTVGSWMGWV